MLFALGMRADLDLQLGMDMLDEAMNGAADG
jgi:hypothetical protein